MSSLRSLARRMLSSVSGTDMAEGNPCPILANPYAGHWPGKEGAKPPPEIKLNDITGRIQEGMTAVVNTRWAGRG